MTLLASHPLSTTFAGVFSLQTLGSGYFNDSALLGVPGRLDLANGAAKCTVKDTDPDTYGGRRTEMTFSHQLDPTGERWYTWKFMIPPSWPTSTACAIMQIHETTNAGAPTPAPQFLLTFEGNHLVTRVPVDVLAPGNSSYRSADCPFEFDRWYSMCFHANWQRDSTGFWELFVDRVPMFKRYGFANAYDDVVGAYLKLGIYDYNKAVGTKTMYVRDVNIWSGNDGYQTVMGGVPLAPARTLQL
ncbi:Polysaccharide lyase [Nitrosospira sp. Nl5]|uniref:heparin lyase I family protein n=1 Tax=Nitrosospira sp. Nl5 TaxID=200120 RepID=UPI00088C0D5B|nr:heparin lyase I family protein [Nitrosospira sp. Nl5]SCY26176.1 Polysaccharide lyase [Nitrosospira sp. Nl5]